LLRVPRALWTLLLNLRKTRRPDGPSVVGRSMISDFPSVRAPAPELMARAMGFAQVKEEPAQRAGDTEQNP